MSFMRVGRPEPCSRRLRARAHMGGGAPCSKSLVRRFVALRRRSPDSRRAGATLRRRSRSWRWAIRSTAGLRPARQGRFRAALCKRRCRQGARGRNQQCRRLRRHRIRRPGAARLVGAGGHRRGHPRTRRQRHAARHQPGGHARGARRDPAPPDRAPHRGPVVRHARGAQSWAPITASAFERIYPELAAKYDVLLYPFFLDGVAGHPKLDAA